MGEESPYIRRLSNRYVRGDLSLVEFEREVGREVARDRVFRKPEESGVVMESAVAVAKKGVGVVALAVAIFCFAIVGAAAALGVLALILEALSA